MEETTTTLSGISSASAAGVVAEMKTERKASSGECIRYRGISQSSASFTSPTTVLRRLRPTRKHDGEGLVGYIISEMKKNEKRVAAEVY